MRSNGCGQPLIHPKKKRKQINFIDSLAAPHSFTHTPRQLHFFAGLRAPAAKKGLLFLAKREEWVGAGRSSSLWASCLGLRPANNPQRKQAIGQLSLSPQEQQPNQSHSIKNKSFVFYWWIDGWTVPLGAMAAAKQIHLFFPLGREEKNEFCCCWWPAVQPSSSIIKQINFTLLNCFIV